MRGTIALRGAHLFIHTIYVVYPNVNFFTKQFI